MSVAAAKRSLWTSPRRGGTVAPRSLGGCLRSVGKEYRHVHARRREVFRRGWPHPLLGCEPGQLGPWCGTVRQGFHRMLPRVPGSGACEYALEFGALPKVLRGGPVEGR